MNANHSHNGARLDLDLEDLPASHGPRRVDKEYFCQTVAKIAGAARQAKQNKQPETGKLLVRETLALLRSLECAACCGRPGHWH